MNYIVMINRFWLLRKEYQLTASAVDLYFYLLHTSNQLAWKNPFQHSNKQIMGGTSLGNDKTIATAKNRLREVGLIEFTSGYRGVGPPTLVVRIVKHEINNLKIC